MSVILYTISFLLFLYIAASTIYLLIIAFAGKFMKGKRYTFHPVKKNIAVLIPSFREDNIIIDTAEQAVAHNYDKNHFDVFVIADQLKAQTVEKLKSLVHVIEVRFEK